MWDTFDYLVVVYFALHIPTTLLIDAQCVLPPAWFPPQLQQLVEWHVATNHDPFIGVGARAPWFRGIVWAELLLQARGRERRAASGSRGAGGGDT